MRNFILAVLASIVANVICAVKIGHIGDSVGLMVIGLVVASIILALEHFTGIIRAWQRLILIALVVSLSVEVSLVYSRWIGNVHSRIDLPLSPNAEPAVPVLADFNNCRPLNLYGRQLGGLNDNSWNGNSTVNLFTEGTDSNQGGCYLVMDYHLGSRATIPPYCGMFSPFSTPGEARDVSAYQGISLYAWHQDGPPKSVNVYLQISPSEMNDWDDGYFYVNLTDEVQKTTREPIARIPFTDFKPSGPLEKVGFHGSFDKHYQRRVYQVAVVIQGTIKGQEANGQIAVDDIRFY
jgi:hypothetical protein